ncbi:alpha/beta hydrolase [Paenibacillus sp. JX-17]|uniref:Alpha/beta hydrolase n=1 Tax=Paenibacillus lacisoli TaxID=3064525 RepID=A0ABT9CFX8_9BACL|nr:alpha/beta hydrolase [Paenibacillus sp. JX-17]MDO7908180.1 alpha/beta hydrolase [Paenibacillus sp. JX-17]
MQSGMLEVNGTKLWHLMNGQGLPVVLLHGGPGSYDYMEPVAEMLTRDYQVIRYDQRGSFRSAKKGPYHTAIMIKDLEQLRMSLGIERWVVCGHSWGAFLALAYTACYEERVEALIYMSGTGIDPDWHQDYRVNRLKLMQAADREEYTYLRSTVEQLSGKEQENALNRIRYLSAGTDLFYPERRHLLPKTESPYLNAEVNASVNSDTANWMVKNDFRLQVRKIRVPSLFVHGAADPRPAGYAARLSQLLSNSRMKVLPQAGHYPWIDQPALLCQTLRDFLNNYNLEKS